MTHRVSAAEAFLQKELEEYPNLPPLTQHVMRRLSSGADAAAVWLELGDDRRSVNRVVSLVRQSLYSAQRETKRAPRSDEHADIENVIKLARELKRAIRMAMPGDKAQLFTHELLSRELPPVPIAFGWHSLTPADPYGYPLAVCDVLDWAVVMAEEHRNGLPVRASLRASEQTEITAFVRYLAWHFHQEFGQEKRGTIARIASMVFDLETPLDGKDVERRLESRPDAFKPPG
jgi:hypothetical protein